MNLILQFIVLNTILFTVNAQWDPNFAPGRDTIVHLFEWKWADIALECEKFLGPNGFGGVQISPPNENAVITTPYRPWWERYQPVSYKLITRSGNEAEFKSMVKRCNAVNVRIYVDAVINHMTGNTLVGKGTGGSSFDATKKSYPAVPFTQEAFNNKTTCETQSGSIVDYQNTVQVRNCELSGLRDLNHGNAQVKQKIVQYLNKLIGFGVAGFRIDASKHMWPTDLKSIISQCRNLSVQHGFKPRTKPFIVQEVIDLGNEPIKGSEYFDNGRVTEFRYGMNLGEVFRKLNNQKLKYLQNYGEGWAFYKDKNALVFIDNHDNQRGHGAGGANILTFRNSRLYKMANAFMLAWPYGVPRVMSSYNWEQKFQDGSDKNDWVGPPNKDGNTLNVGINKDGTCSGSWICEHRWRQIFDMVQFRNVVAGTNMSNWWDNGGNQIAFSRGSSGFIAINNEDFALTATVSTSMPAGKYCDVISGVKKENSCTGKVIIVDEKGQISLNVPNDEDPMIAIHAGVKI